MAKPKAKIRRHLVIEYNTLPKAVKESVMEWLGFGNDVMLSVTDRSEFDLDAYRKGMPSVEDYWREQTSDNQFSGTLKDFIREYGLEFDVWLIKQNFDLTDVDDVVIEIVW